MFFRYGTKSKSSSREDEMDLSNQATAAAAPFLSVPYSVIQEDVDDNQV